MRPRAAARGKTAHRQIDTLAPLGEALSAHLGLPAQALRAMRNGYALCTPKGLDAMGQHLQKLSEADLDSLRGKLAVGVHRDVAVTDVPGAAPPLVTQIYCSALPVAYSNIEATAWEPFARLILDAGYQATMLAAAENLHRGGSPTVLLTRLDGGAFGNPDDGSTMR